MSKKIKIGFMYSENSGKAPHNSEIKGWPEGITYASIINGISEKGGEPYNLRWEDLDENLTVSSLYNLSEPKILSDVSLEYLDVLCFMGFGNVLEVRKRDEELCNIVRRLDETQIIPTINPAKTVLKAREEKKRYLIDLFENNISIPDTYIAESLDEVHDMSFELLAKYGGYVTKPLNGFGGYGVEKFPGGNSKTIEEILKEDKEIIVQGYIDNIQETGERSVFIFGKDVNYTVLKKSSGFKTNVTRNLSGVNRSLVQCTKEEERLAFEAKELIAQEAMIVRADLIGNRNNPYVGEITLSSIGLHTAVFENKENLAVKGYWELINNLIK